VHVFDVYSSVTTWTLTQGYSLALAISKVLNLKWDHVSIERTVCERIFLVVFRLILEVSKRGMRMWS